MGEGYRCVGFRNAAVAEVAAFYEERAVLDVERHAALILEDVVRKHLTRWAVGAFDVLIVPDLRIPREWLVEVRKFRRAVAEITQLRIAVVIRAVHVAHANVHARIENFHAQVSGEVVSRTLNAGTNVLPLPPMTVTQPGSPIGAQGARTSGVAAICVCG